MFLAANVKKLADITIISNNGTRIDYDAYAMTDIQPVSYFYRPRYLHAIKARKPVMLKTGYDVKRILFHAQPKPERIGEPVVPGGQCFKDYLIKRDIYPPPKYR